MNEKKCFTCERPMADEECGDELPEERICDECVGRLEIAVYDRRHGEWWFGYVAGKVKLKTDGDRCWFEVETVLDAIGPTAVYNETGLRWEAELHWDGSVL